jgi:hypothetical protein
MPGRRRRVDEIPPVQAAVVGVNIRVLRQQHGSNQSIVGDLMGWPSNSTVCAAEGRRNGRQRGFTSQEVERLATIFGIFPAQLMTQCANCGGQPPTGFACLTCGARLQT